MAHRARRFIRGGRQVRETLWVGLTETRTSLAAANTAAFILSLNAAALALRPFTVTRSLLHWSVRSDQSAASENYATALGLSVVSDQASAIGITAIPTPFTDIGSDLFFLHDILDGHFLFISGVGVEGNSNSPVGGVTVQSKAMRRVEEGSDIAIVIENDGLSSGTQVYVTGRMLVKLH